MADLFLELRNVVNRLEQRFGDVKGFSRPKLVLNDLMISRTEKIEDSDERELQELEWDNLLILDACRYDIYEEVLGREVDHNFSKASMTRYFIRDNFSEGDWSDVVYVTLNPHFSERFLNNLPEGGLKMFSLKFSKAGKI